MKCPKCRKAMHHERLQNLDMNVLKASAVYCRKCLIGKYTATHELEQRGVL